MDSVKDVGVKKVEAGRDGHPHDGEVFRSTTTP
jgi:hypothetical protein